MRHTVNTDYNKQGFSKTKINNEIETVSKSTLTALEHYIPDGNKEYASFDVNKESTLINFIKYLSNTL